MKKSVSVLLALVLMLSTVFSVNVFAKITYDSIKITKDGQSVDALDGVKAVYKKGLRNTDTGDYSCAGYVKKYYKAVHKVNVYNLISGGTPLTQEDKYSFVKTNSPQKGDIAYIPGHWMIIKSVSNNKVVVIEQNWKWMSGSSTYAAKNRTFTGDDYKKLNFYTLKGKSVCKQHTYNDKGYCKNCGEEYKISLKKLSDKTMYTIKNDVPVRNRPYKAEKTIKKLPKNEKVIVVAYGKNSYENIWYKLKDGTWIYSDNLKENKSKSESLSDVAKAEIGYQGRDKKGKGTGDYTKYGEFTGTNGQPWCASFVSWCVNQAGVSTKIVPKTASCDQMEDGSNNYHKWNKNALNSLKKNDVIFFAESSDLADSTHVGIVTAVDKSKMTITLVEGNTKTDVVKENTYKVEPKTGKIVKGWSGHSFCGYISVN